MFFRIQKYAFLLLPANFLSFFKDRVTLIKLNCRLAHVFSYTLIIYNRLGIRFLESFFPF